MDALFYSYAYPVPDGFENADPGPSAASYSTQMKEFVLPYAAVRASDDPDAMVLEFFQKTYEAAALLGGWDRPSLERA